MINWFNMPDEGLSNGGLFEVKELEVTENGTYETSGEMYNKVTVNVEGGGGSSDFSTAELTMDNTYGTEDFFIDVPYIEDGFIYATNSASAGTTKTVTILLYQGKTWIYADGLDVEGNAIYDSENDTWIATGDCSVRYGKIYKVTVNSVLTEEYSIDFNGRGNEYAPIVNGEPSWIDGYELILPIGSSSAEVEILVIDSTYPAEAYMNAREDVTPTVSGAIQFVDDDGWHFNITGDGTITIS